MKKTTWLCIASVAAALIVVAITYGKAAIDRTLLATELAASKQAECEIAQTKKFGSVGPWNRYSDKERVVAKIAAPNGQIVRVEGPPDATEGEFLSFAETSLKQNQFADLIPNRRWDPPAEGRLAESNRAQRVFNFAPSTGGTDPSSTSKLFSGGGICEQAEKVSLELRVQESVVRQWTESGLIWALAIAFIGSLPALIAFTWRFLLARLREVSNAIRGG